MSHLPKTLEARYELALEKVSAPQKVCLLKHIYENPNTYTHTLARECAIGYPPARIWELNRDVLWKLGLSLNCYKPEEPLINRFGGESNVHKWKLELLKEVQHGNAA